jgi:DNA-binding NtrC family response regulator
MLPRTGQGDARDGREGAAGVKPRILLIASPGEPRHLALALDPAFEVTTCETLEDALGRLRDERWDAALAQYELRGGTSGLEVLQSLRDSEPRVYRVLFSSQVCPSLVHDATRLARVYATLDQSAPDFCERMVSVMEELLLATPSKILASGLSVARDPAVRWIGSAPVSREFLLRLHDAARSACPVFLTGEPGSGKSLAARLLRERRAEWRESAPPARPEREVIVLRIPPLRERIQDLPALADRWLWRHAPGGDPPHLSLAALRLLMARPWHGNVAELHQTLAHSLRRAGAGASIGVSDLPPGQQPGWRPSQHAKDDGQRECVLRQLRAARNVSGAARLEGSSRANYIRLMRRLGIVRADTHPDDVDES